MEAKSSTICITEFNNIMNAARSKIMVKAKTDLWNTKTAQETERIQELQ